MGALVGDVQILQTLTTHTSDINSIDFASDYILVTASGLVKKIQCFLSYRLFNYFNFYPIEING